MSTMWEFLKPNPHDLYDHAVYDFLYVILVNVVVTISRRLSDNAAFVFLKRKGPVAIVWALRSTVVVIMSYLLTIFYAMGIELVVIGLNDYFDANHQLDPQAVIVPFVPIYLLYFIYRLGWGGRLGAALSWFWGHFALWFGAVLLSAIPLAMFVFEPRMSNSAPLAVFLHGVLIIVAACSIYPLFLYEARRGTWRYMAASLGVNKKTLMVLQ